MIFLIIRSWLLLLYFDYIMRFTAFRALHDSVRECPVRTIPKRRDSGELCHAIDIACVLYFNQVLCLQRSAATTVLLRRYGWNATMMIGVQLTPPEFHAWVEIAENVVNDKPYIRSIYLLLETC